jgi:hypothetical protein
MYISKMVMLCQYPFGNLIKKGQVIPHHENPSDVGAISIAQRRVSTVLG